MTSATRVQRPLLALWRHHRRHRPRVVMAALCTVVNQVADVAPELIIGVAVDVVVRGGNSWMATVTGFTLLEQRPAALGGSAVLP